jgi:hypothetical protein
LKDKENPKISQSLLDELSEANELLDTALIKAKNLANYNSLKGQVTDEDYYGEEEGDEEVRQVKPTNWDSMKNAALEDSIDAMEEESVELASDTKKVRNVKPKNKKLRIDDNWEDDPF